MKFLIITRANYPSSSWGNRVRMIAKGLIENGVEVNVLVTYPWPSQESIDNSEDFVNYLTPARDKKESVFSLFKQINTLFILRKKLKSYKDVSTVLLTGDRWLDSIFVSHFCKKTQAKFFVEVVDEVGRQFDNKKNTIYNSLAILNRRLFNNNLNKIDKLFVLSSFLEKKYQRMINAKKIIRCSPTYVNQSDYDCKLKNFKYFNDNKNLINDDEVVISYAGSCARPNGLIFFLEAARKFIAKKKCNVKIIFVFHIGEISIVEDYVKKLDIPENVIIIPGLNSNYIPSIYERSDILILPEQGDVVANAGFPGKVGEYLISGKAIISTKFSDLETYLKNGYNCLMSDIGDEKTYQENLAALISDKELRMKLGENAKITGEKNFNFINAVKIYLN